MFSWVFILNNTFYILTHLDFTIHYTTSTTTTTHIFLKLKNHVSNHFLITCWLSANLFLYWFTSLSNALFSFSSFLSAFDALSGFVFDFLCFGCSGSERRGSRRCRFFGFFRSCSFFRRSFRVIFGVSWRIFGPECLGSVFTLGSEMVPVNPVLTGFSPSNFLCLCAGRSGFSFLRPLKFGLFCLLFSSLFCRAWTAFLFSIEKSTIGLCSGPNISGLLFIFRNAAK